jgi:hypothetical protein
MAQLSKEQCEKFNTAWAWHDSKLERTEIVSGIDDAHPSVCFEIRSVSSKSPDRKIKIFLKDCRLLRSEMDFFGIQLCGGDIANVYCDIESAFKKQVEEDILTNFDLPQAESPLADYCHFRVLLIHPGGKIDVFAKSFELLEY